MRVWVGFALLAAGVGLCVANFRTLETGNVEQVVQGLVASNSAPAAIPVAKSGSTVAERRALRRAAAMEEAQRNGRVSPAAWERPEVEQPQVTSDYTDRVVLPAERLVIIADTQPAAPTDRYELARVLQTELKRVGCYFGDVDGDWGPGSKRAMGSFTEQVNASLPVENPDHILLKMVQRYEGRACGASCRGSETRTEDGRCVPTAVIAAADRSANRPTLHSSATGERMYAPVPSPIIVGQSPSATVSAEAPRPIAVEPLPGRMSVGVMGNVGAVRVPMSREGSVGSVAVAPASEPTRRAQRRRVTAEAPSAYRAQASAPSRKRWTQNFFEGIAMRQ